MKKLVFYLFILAMALIACNNGENAGIVPTTTFNETPLPQATTDTTNPDIVTPPPTPILPVATPSSLTIWLPPEFSPAPTNPKGIDLAAQIDTFSASQTTYQINYAARATSGSASMLNYLRTGRNIAPTILPDLILLPADQLTIANNEQLIYPISPYLTQEDINDLFPPALDIATIGEELMGYPHTLSGLTHLVYNPTIFTDTVPALWSQLIQTNASLTLPTNNGLPATLIMQIYFELGGSLLNENNRFFLDQTTLSQAFAQIQKARQAEVLSLQSIDTDDYAQAWASLTTGNANMTILDSQRYLIERQTDTSYLYASIPGFDTPLKPILSGWVWVLTTADPETQQQASDLIHFLTSPETLGKWSFEHQLIPARPSAFATWSPNDPYANFLQTELNHSDPNPTISNNNLNNLLQEEFFNIINLISSPDEAAQRIVTQINQP